MLPVLITVLMVCAAIFANDVLEDHGRLTDIYTTKQKQHDMLRVAESLELYRATFHQFPASLTALAATPGFEQLQTNLNGWQGYGVSGAITDGTWTFSRAVAFTNDPSAGTTALAYLSQNSCGTGSYATSTQGWCGTKSSLWYVKDTRADFQSLITTQRVRLNRLAQKFNDFRNTNSEYPSKDAAGIALATSATVALADLANYSGTASTCSGQYQYMGIPIDCADMFDLWGGKIGYQFESVSHVIFVSESPIFNGTGGRVVIAVDLT